jgi:F0F1-type ATP synthase assembly protein I
MDMVTWAGSFLLGGVSALLVMCLLLFFMERPVKKPKDNQVLKQIADALQTLPEFK